jgi:hypothetical protein
VAILEAVGDYVDTQVAALTMGANLFLGMMPNSPDLCVAVYEKVGNTPVEHLRDGGVSLERVRIQVLVRGARDDYVTPRDLSLQVRGVLQSVVDQSLSGISVMRIQSDAWIGPMASESDDRPMFSAQFRAIYQP